MEVEERCSVAISDEDAEKCDTVADLITLVTRLKEGA